MRKDRSSQGGGVAFCYKIILNVVILDTPIPAGLEIIIIKMINKDGHGTLCVGCYRPPSQGAAFMELLNENLDHLLTTHRCDSVIILGKLNPRGIQRAFDSFLAVFDPTNHVKFPTHRSGSILDPVIKDLLCHNVSYFPPGPVGTSDHKVILTRINFRKPRDESTTRTYWQ